MRLSLGRALHETLQSQASGDSHITTATAMLRLIHHLNNLIDFLSLSLLSFYSQLE